MAQALLGGLLPAIYSGADQLKRGVYGLLTNPQEQAERAAQSLLQSRAERQALMARTFANPDRPFQVTDQAGLAQLGTDVLTGELGIAPVGMTAWHGSPHNILGKFDISKVGTGEGAQAYGHGMYFAEAKGTGEQYAKGLSYPDIKFMGEPIGRENRTLKPVKEWANYNNLPTEQKNLLLEAYYSGKSPIDWLEQTSKIGGENNLRAKNAKELLGNFESAGFLYKVDIPDEYVPKMLDYDKPLSQQPKNVLDSLKKLNDPYINEALTTKPKLSDDGEYWTYMGNTYATKQEALEDVTGQRLISGYTNIAKNPQELSSVLNSVGIKGVKYLDQDSRMIGNGTSNFVVFDPTDVKILERNNQPFEGLLGN